MTERLALVSLPVGALRDLLAERTRSTEGRLRVRLPASLARRAQRLLQVRLGDVERDPGARPWLLRLVALRDEHPRTVVGLIGFHGRPDASGRVEVGYEIFTPFRRHGYATEAVLGLLAWAARRNGPHTFVAAIAPDNEPSMRLARRIGFRQVGVQVNEEGGLELVYELQWPRRSLPGVTGPTRRPRGCRRADPPARVGPFGRRVRPDRP